MPDRHAALGKILARNRLVAAILAIVAVVACASAAAQPRQPGLLAAPAVTPFPQAGSFVELDSTVTYSDNATRVPDKTVDDYILAEGLDMNYVRQGSSLGVRLRGDINWIDYLHHSYTQQAQGFFDGTGVYSIIDKALQWTAEETYGQALRNPFQATTPDNLQNINYFSTGPQFALGELNQLTGFALFSRANYADTDMNSDMLSGGLAFKHLISAHSSVSFNATDQSVRFDQHVTNANFDIEQAFGRYQNTGGRTTMVADLGYSVLNDHQGDNKGGLLVHFDGARAISGASSVYLSLAQEYATTADALRADSPIGAPVNNATGLFTADPFRERAAALGWVFNGRRTRFSIAGTWLEQKFEQRIEFNQRVLGATVLLQRQLRPTWTGALQYTLESVHFQDVQESDRERFISAELTKRFTVKLRGSIAYDHYSRVTLGNVTNYGENEVLLRVMYMLIGAR